MIAKRRLKRAYGKKAPEGRQTRTKKLGRIPLPRKSGGPQTTKKGKKGYSRKRQKERLRRHLPTFLS